MKNRRPPGPPLWVLWKELIVQCKISDLKFAETAKNELWSIITVSQKLRLKKLSRQESNLGPGTTCSVLFH